MPEKTCADKKFVPIYAVISVISCFGYLIVLKTIHNCRLHQKPRFLILIYLSLSDCIFVLMLTIMYATVAFLPPSKTCVVVTTVGKYICTVSFYISCGLSVALTLNQYLAVAHGLQYPLIVTAKRINYSTLAWSIAMLIICGLMLLDKKLIIILSTKMLRSHSIITATIITLSGFAMLTNLIYSNHISYRITKSLTAQQLQTPFWRRRRHIRMEVTVITAVVIAVLIPQAVYYIKIHVRHDTFDEVWLAVTRAMLLLFSALNPFLYMFTLSELRKRVFRTVKQLLMSTTCTFVAGNRSTYDKSRRFSTISMTRLSTLTIDRQPRRISYGGVMSPSVAKYAQKEFKELKAVGIIPGNLSGGVYVREIPD